MTRFSTPTHGGHCPLRKSEYPMLDAVTRITRSAAVPLALAVAMTLSVAQPGAAQERLNRTIQTLSEGHPVFGILSGDYSLHSARSIARSGLDFTFIDMEHSPWNTETLRTYLLGMTDKAAMARTGSLQMATTPIVRIPQNGNEMLDFLVKQTLDMGAFGVMFPFISKREEAVNAIRSMRYPRPTGSPIEEPRGWRGRSPGIASWYWGIGGGEYYERADVWPLNPQGELLAVLQIETREGLENAEEIISTPGVGALFIGPLDLATQMGYGDRTNHPDVEEAIQHILSLCKQYDVPCGLTTGAGNVEERIRQGFKFVTVGGDGGITGGTATALQRGMAAASRN
ncbi:MAG: aldolase/citrate lyase family protein [Gemmatimonadota bacterium]